MLEWLEEWYFANCNGDWEHNFGIKIETIDNPGWEITIDLENTEVDLNLSKWKQLSDSEDNWVGYKIENQIYNAAGSPKNLCVLIFIFKELIENGYIEDKVLIKKLKRCQNS